MNTARNLPNLINTLDSSCLIGFYYLDNHGGTNAPCNIEQINPDHCRILFDISGYDSKNIDLTLKDNLLTIRCIGSHQERSTALFQNIGLISFECNFYLNNNVNLTNVLNNNGLLVIDLKKLLPFLSEPLNRKGRCIFTKCAKPCLETEDIDSE